MATNRTHRHHQHQCRSATCRPNPSTGLCASCLRERLAGIENQSSSSTSQLSRTRSCSSRARTSAAEQPRRRSCDARPQSSSLHDLFAVEDDGTLERKYRVLDLDPPLEEEGEEGEEHEGEVTGLVCKSKRRGFVVEDTFKDVGELKMMKEFIDLELTNQNKNAGRDLREIASGFSRTLRKLKMKNRDKSEHEGANAGFARSKGTRSEIVEFGKGRRSCDTDPRLSLDAARISVDEPRASWDGCLIGNGYPPVRPMVPVVEEVQSTSKNGVDGEEDDTNPGGPAQITDCASMQKRIGFERSGSVRRSSLVEIDDPKVVPNGKVSPETFDLTRGKKLMVTEKELRDSNWYSIKAQGKESVECGPKGGGDVSDKVTQKGVGLKKKNGWFNKWNVWGLIQRKSDTKCRVGEQNSIKLEGNAIDESAIPRRTTNNPEVCRHKSPNPEENVVEGLSVQRRIPSKVAVNQEKELEGNITGDPLVQRQIESKSDLKQKKNLRYEGNIVEGSLAESLLKLRRASRGEVKEDSINERKLFCNYSVRARNSCDGPINGIHSGRNSSDGLFRAANSFEGGRKSCDGSVDRMKSEVQGKEDILLQRNRSTRYPPNNFDDKSILPFYLTPLRSFKGSRFGRSRLENSDSLVEMS